MSLSQVPDAISAEIIRTEVLIRNDRVNIARNLYLSSIFSDCTIVCGNKNLKVHRIVLCPQSPFFERAFNGKFQESASNSLDLSAEDPQAVENLVHAMYGVPTNFGRGRATELALLHALAKKLLVHLVAKLALFKLRKEWQRTGDPAAVEYFEHLKHFKSFSAGMPALVNVAYVEMPEECNELRALIVQRLVEFSRTFDVKVVRHHMDEAFIISRDFALDLLSGVDKRAQAQGSA